MHGRSCKTVFGWVDSTRDGRAWDRNDSLAVPLVSGPLSGTLQLRQLNIWTKLTRQLREKGSINLFWSAFDNYFGKVVRIEPIPSVSITDPKQPSDSCGYQLEIYFIYFFDDIERLEVHLGLKLDGWTPAASTAAGFGSNVRECANFPFKRLGFGSSFHCCSINIQILPFFMSMAQLVDLEPKR